ncbi:MAG: multicopper oxidase domain-containing protein [Vicinamibacterales bacterium]|jgi:FtsP/CotA-like multicopper oxidase with cupredoxin domain
MRRRDALHLLGMAPFANLARSLERQAAPAKPPDVEIVLTAAPAEVSLLPGAPTRVLQFRAKLVRGPADTVTAVPDSYLGPVLRLKKGQRVRIHFENRTGESSIVHWHGLDVPERADGHPRLAVEHGRDYTHDFEVTNRAGTYWYHPHPHMRTAAQVYQGLAGLVLVSDPEEDALQLPSGAGELLCVLQDRRFDAKNQFVYLDAGQMGGMGRGRGMMGMGGGMGQMMATMNGWLGDRMLVSGRVQPAIDVDRRTYRVRLLNGSNSRFYKLAWSDESPITAIGNDGGLFERPRTMRTLTLAPGQRADVLLDLSSHAAGATVQLRSVGFPAGHAGSVGMMGDTSPVPQGAPLTLMTLRVSNRQGPRVAAPARLSSLDWRAQPAAPVRRVPLTFMQMTWLLDGRTFDMAEVSAAETVKAGSTQIWEIENQTNPMGMAMAHPIHVHGTQFRVLSRTGGSANALRDGIHDDGWTDTVLVLPGETVRAQLTFSRHPGLYLYHCHILEHEDMGMMRNLRIT